MNPPPALDASKQQEPGADRGTGLKSEVESTMNRYANRFSLPAAAIAAVVALSVTGGVAALFQSKAGIAGPSVHTLAARVPAQALPIREVVPNRVEVFAVREPERVSASCLKERG